MSEKKEFILLAETNVIEVAELMEAYRKLSSSDKLQNLAMLLGWSTAELTKLKANKEISKSENKTILKVIKKEENETK
tara:strand:- start:82 stop:315 length:234 start_codon:yes stop_codon:yes gene_type:complete